MLIKQDCLSNKISGIWIFQEIQIFMSAKEMVWQALIDQGALIVGWIAHVPLPLHDSIVVNSEATKAKLINAYHEDELPRKTT